MMDVSLVSIQGRFSRAVADAINDMIAVAVVLNYFFCRGVG